MGYVRTLFEYVIFVWHHTSNYHLVDLKYHIVLIDRKPEMCQVSSIDWRSINSSVSSSTWGVFKTLHFIIWVFWYTVWCFVCLNNLVSSMVHQKNIYFNYYIILKVLCKFCFGSCYLILLQILYRYMFVLLLMSVRQIKVSCTFSFLVRQIKCL